MFSVMNAGKRSIHVAKIVRRCQGKTYVSYLLRHSFRDGKHVRHKTLANLSHLPESLIHIVQRALKGEKFVATSEAFRTTDALPHGHVHAVLGTLRKLQLDTLIASEPSRQRDLCLALIVERVLFPASKLASLRHWQATTLASELALTEVTEKEVYQAMDWLLTRQSAIERKLAQRHLREQAPILYDVSSSFYYGRTCPLARYGHDRDGKKGLPIIVYGLLTDGDGRPVAIQVYPGNTNDATTVPGQVNKLRKRFHLQRLILVGDRGMLTDTQIEKLRAYPGLRWISALRSTAIRALLDKGHLQRSLFDDANLAELRSPDFPGERLIACHNPLLEEERRRKRRALLQKTEEALQGLVAEVHRRTDTPLTAGVIGIKAGQHLKHWKMAKHFQVTIGDGVFTWARRPESIAREEELDGIYVIRTSATKRQLSASDTVRHYKRLAQVEQGFRTLKGLDLLVRPIHHRVPPRVRAHFLLCMLSYYVEWELRRAWRPLLFADEELATARNERDPVQPAEASQSAQAKKKTKRNTAGEPVHSFRTLLAELARQTRNTHVITGIEGKGSFTQVVDANALQAKAFALLGL
jgi:transposase